VVLWFHDLALCRIIAAELLRSGLTDREPLAHRHLTEDIVGAFVAQQYSEIIHSKGRTIEDIIGSASFIPAIDNLLYAPQIPFREVYIRSVEEPDIFRDEPWRFMNETPRGKRIFGKLEDLLGHDGAASLMVEYLGSEISFKDTLEKRLKADAKIFFSQWYGSYPEVNYRVGNIEDLKKPGGVFLHRIEVIRDGDSIKEPVTVRIKMRTTLQRTWFGTGRERQGLLSGFQRRLLIRFK
jgi:hypothetical protein